MYFGNWLQSDSTFIQCDITRLRQHDWKRIIRSEKERSLSSHLCIQKTKDWGAENKRNYRGSENSEERTRCAYWKTQISDNIIGACKIKTGLASLWNTFFTWNDWKRNQRCIKCRISKQQCTDKLREWPRAISTHSLLNQA